MGRNNTAHNAVQKQGTSQPWRLGTAVVRAVACATIAYVVASWAVETGSLLLYIAFLFTMYWAGVWIYRGGLAVAKARKN